MITLLKNNIFFIFIFIFIFINNMIVHFGTDYSWGMYIADYYNEYNKFYNPSANSYGGWGNIYTFFNAFIVSVLGKYYMNYWIFNYIYSVFGVYIFYKLLYLMYNDNAAKLGTLIYVYLAFGSGLFAGGRPESIYTTSLVLLLFCVEKFQQTGKYYWTYLASFSAIIGALSHPNGLILFVLLGILAIKLFINNKLSFKELSINLLSVIVFIILLMFGQTIHEFLFVFHSTNSDKIHNIALTLSNEYKRYHHFYGVHLYMKNIFHITMYSAYLFVIYYLVFKRDNFIKSFISYSIVVILIYLFVIRIKHDYYLALLFPLYSIAFVDLTRYKLFIIKIFRYLLIVYLIFNMGRILIKDFSQNELFLETIKVNTLKVLSLEKIRNKIRNKRILAPMILYPITYNVKLFVPTQSKVIYNKNFDYVILDGVTNVNKYEQKLNLKLKFIETFTYNTYNFKLYKVENK